MLLPSFSTFHHLVADSLMPWLDCHADEEKFRRLLRSPSVNSSVPAQQFFDALPAAFKRMGLPLHPELLNEWNSFRLLPLTIPLPDAMQQVIMTDLCDSPRRIFFTLLSGHATLLFWQWYRLAAEEADTPDMELFTMMESLKRLDYILTVATRPLPEIARDSLLAEKITLEIALLVAAICNTKSELLAGKEGYLTGMALAGKVLASARLSLEEVTQLPAAAKNPETSPQQAAAPPYSKTANSMEGALQMVSEKDPLYEMVYEMRTGLTEITHKVKDYMANTLSRKERTDEHVSTLEAARIANVTRGTITEWRKKGVLKDVIRKGEKTYLFNREEVERLKRGR